MKALLALTLLISSTVTWAFPRAPFNALERANNKSMTLDNQGYDFEGIVKLSNCSGSLVAFNGQPTSSRAVVMTNGHCIQKPGGYLNPGEVWVNKPVSRDMKIFDHNMQLHNVRAIRILYATMTNTDVAFYELSESYDSIKSKTNVTPFILDGSHPTVGAELTLISGYWDRGWTCSIDSFIFKMREGDWTFTDSIRYTETCDTMGGTSGSPLIAKGERRVIGINNTSNEKGERCTLNNPCEVHENGTVIAAKGVRYGQQTFNVYSCLTPDFAFNLQRSGCTMPR